MRRAEILASSSVRMCDLTIVMSDRSVRTIVRKLHVNSEVFVLQLRNDVLQRVAIAARHAHDVTLNRSLDLGFTVFDELHDLFGFVLSEYLAEFARVVARCRRPPVRYSRS